MLPCSTSYSLSLEAHHPGFAFQRRHVGSLIRLPDPSSRLGGKRSSLHVGKCPVALGTSMSAGELTVERPTWESLREQLGRSRPADGGVRLAHAKERIFGSDTQPALLLYRDNASWCPYCERVWLQLEEKQLSYAVEKINMRCYGTKPDWFMKMVPSGLLPVIKLNGKVVTESMDIMLLLEKTFPERNPLLPAQGSPESKAVSELIQLERTLTGAWLSGLRGSWGSVGGFEGVLDKVDLALKRFGGPYFLGSKFSLVDAVYAPFLERMAAGAPYWQGFVLRGSSRWPALNAWFDALDTRPSYAAMKSDDFTIAHNLEPQIGPIKFQPKGAAYRDKVNGKNGHWDLPLQPEDTAWGSDDGTGGGGAKEEAAWSLASNNEAVVGFALRGVPDGEKLREDVDRAFQHVAYALAFGVENAGDMPNGIPPEVAVAAAYLRDRVGVPRDLSYPAARQLRAHLHWLVRQLGSDL
eukprot:TRINITY_DN1405_c0_g1_i1.p1 TRINITY_DN1405_c0_g1~~TRINITY_DN1405_c0_g1_i1.p1  ORF type:complete len:467 (+),score=61.92 TRINITY_DN1405_c0_g1_i1:75-1475(+)